MAHERLIPLKTSPPYNAGRWFLVTGLIPITLFVGIFGLIMPAGKMDVSWLLIHTVTPMVAAWVLGVSIGQPIVQQVDVTRVSAALRGAGVALGSYGLLIGVLLGYDPIIKGQWNPGKMFSVSLLFYSTGAFPIIFLGAFSGLFLRKKAHQIPGVVGPIFGGPAGTIIIGLLFLSIPAIYLSWLRSAKAGISQVKESSVYFVSTDVKMGEILSFNNFGVFHGSRTKEAPSNAIRGSVYLKPGAYKAKKNLPANTFLTWEMIEESH